jgi:hypothetical protein
MITPWSMARCRADLVVGTGICRQLDEVIFNPLALLHLVGLFKVND